jgi:PAS domain S-box-containing protein
MQLYGNEDYHKMVEEIEDYAILLLDVNGTVINWNKGAEKIKGYKANEIIGKNFHLFYTSEDRKNRLPEKLLQKASLNGKAREEGWRVRKDGTRFWGTILITAIHDENNNVIGFSKVTRDLTERKDAEETEKKLTQTKESLYLIFNASSTIMTLTDINSGKFVEINDSFLITFGFTREEVIGCNSDELGIVSTETRNKLNGNLIQNRHLKNEAILCYTKEKKQFDCILSADLFEMEGKIYLLSVFQDISSVKEMERRAIESEEKFQKAFQANAAGISIIRVSDSTYLEVNDTFIEMTGYSKEELIGHTPIELGILVNLERREEILKHLRDSGSTKQFEFTIQNKSGRILNILSSLETILMNGEKFVINTIYDITERKKTEEKLGHLSAIVEYSDDAIISKSIDGTIKSWNSGAERMLGYTAAEAIGENISMIIPASYINEEKNVLERICNNEMIDHYETVRVKKNGVEFHASITVSPLKNSTGKIIGLSKSIRDITERKKAEDSSKLKDAFLSIISHEIRTPLNIILGFSNVLLKRNLEPQEKEYVNIIKTAGDSLLTIINNTIDMSKIEAGTMTIDSINFSLKEVFQDLNDKLIRIAAQKNLVLLFGIDNDVPDELLGDPKQLSQIIINLTNNAVTFTENGSINVHIRVLKNDTENTLLEFSVADTGIGISLNKLETIFKRFSQIENPDDRKFGGLGLGLSITKRLVELQGGSLTVDSELKKGSTFSFSLPFKKQISSDKNNSCLPSALAS